MKVAPANPNMSPKLESALEFNLLYADRNLQLAAWQVIVADAYVVYVCLILMYILYIFHNFRYSCQSCWHEMKGSLPSVSFSVSTCARHLGTCAIVLFTIC